MNSKVDLLKETGGIDLIEGHHTILPLWIPSSNEIVDVSKLTYLK
jgi:hypothetical protein